MKKLISLLAILIIFSENAYCQKKPKHNIISNNVRKLFFLKKISKEMPLYIKKLIKAKKESPEAVTLFMQDLKKQTNVQLIRSVFLYRDKELKKDLENYLIKELDTFILAQRFKQTKDDKIKDQLYNTLKESFEIKTKIQKKIIKKMEQRITTLKKLINKKEEIKETIINERLNYLISDHLTDW